MALGPVANKTTSSNSSSTNKTSSTSALQADDFIKLMITQLQNQDPLQPTSNQDLLAQMSQIGQLQSSTDLQTSLKGMVLQNNIGSAGNLIGKTVTGKDSDGADVTGLVNSVKVDKDGVYLELDNGQSLAMSNITQISPAAAVKTAA